MPAKDNVRELDRAMHTARAWINDVARSVGTDDREFAYRVSRAWLHTLRDGLTVDAAAHFAAQLPDLLRGIFYANWNPATPSRRYGTDTFTNRFAEDANISAHDVATVAPKVTAALLQHLPAELLEKALSQFPRQVRLLLLPESSQGNELRRPEGSLRR